MAAILRQTVSNPFDITPARPSCRLDEPFSFPSTTFGLDSISIASVIRDHHQQSSPASIFSAVSAPPFRNNENVPPLLRRKSGAANPRSISSHLAKSPGQSGFQGQIRPRNFTYQPSTRDATIADTQCNNLNVHESVRSLAAGSDEPSHYGAPESKESAAPLHKLRPYTPAPSSTGNGATTTFIPDTSVEATSHNHNSALTPETGLLSRIRELRQESASKHIILPDISPARSEYLTHQQRSSDSSSGFVHSMKTASITNASFSIHPRSSHLYRSTDSHVHFGSQPRASLDSERPLSGYSFDDTAIKRGFRRQQIIDELIATEESYIADLKALMYLHSTILTSTSSISSRMGFATLRNVNEILCIHKKILQKFHGVRLRAAARRWADTVAPERLGYHRRSCVQSFDRGNYAHVRRSQSHRHTRSVDSTEMPTCHFQHSVSAEPIDVYEITIVFKDALRDFYAYEEYCANYEFISRELQKHMPGSWPTFELGMESLARAIVAIDQRGVNEKKGLTVSDLLIKPIQRMTKYPLLLEQLLYNTPVSDGPGTHIELDTVLQNVRNTVQMINLATENHFTRLTIQRRWLLQDRLDLSRLDITADKFKALGTLELCGVLHVAYQSSTMISGGYALCASFDEALLIAFPTTPSGCFEGVAIIQFADIRIASPTDGKGLQCASTLFTWKISFACAGHYHDLIFSGCSRTEEEVWMTAMKGAFGNAVHNPIEPAVSINTCIAFDLKSTGVVFSSQTSLSRESSILRAATVARRTSISQVIIRNTHNTQDPQENRDSGIPSTTINRSQSHATAKRIPVLEPKRSERTRLESSIGDIWTKEVLPFPGMVGSRGGQIIRASAGSLARKLSLASIHTPFSKSRTASFSTISRKSYDLFSDNKSSFQVRWRDPEYVPVKYMKPKDIPEVDDMRSVVGRMIGNGVSVAKKEATASRTMKKSSIQEINPDDSATIFYEHSASLGPHHELISSETSKDSEAIDGNVINLVRTRRKRWSNPISKLKEFGSEAMSILHSNSLKG